MALDVTKRWFMTSCTTLEVDSNTSLTVYFKLFSGDKFVFVGLGKFYLYG